MEEEKNKKITLMVVSSLPDMTAAAYSFFLCCLLDKKYISRLQEEESAEKIEEEYLKIKKEKKEDLLIFTAKTVKEAEDKLIETLPNLPDMVLVDYELAGFGPNGLELIRFIRSHKELNHLRAFLMVSKDKDLLLAEAQKLSCGPFLQSGESITRIFKWTLEEKK
jgi:hypothetical protein